MQGNERICKEMGDFPRKNGIGSEKMAKKTDYWRLFAEFFGKPIAI